MIYIGQTALVIKVQIVEKVGNNTTVIDLSGSTIKLRRLNGQPAEYEAVITDAQNGWVEYEVQDGDIDIAGGWQLQPVVTFSDGKIAKGMPVNFAVEP